jgi:ribosomal protein S18 acetylase RimI-like enzyme
MFEVIVDRRSNRIVGCAGLRPRSRRRAELCKMYILKSAQGWDLGKRLLEDLLDAARQGGFAEVWLETNAVLSHPLGAEKAPGNVRSRFQLPEREIPYSIGFVIVAAVAGYYIGLAYSEVDGVWMIVTATEAVTVILSLLVVRLCGYRLVRLPR